MVMTIKIAIDKAIQNAPDFKKALTSSLKVERINIICHPQILILII